MVTRFHAALMVMVVLAGCGIAPDASSLKTGATQMMAAKRPVKKAGAGNDDFVKNNSRIFFGEKSPEFRKLVEAKGWEKGEGNVSIEPGSEVPKGGTYLVYTTDNWQHTKTSPWRAPNPYNDFVGFALSEPPGTRIEAAIHLYASKWKEGHRGHFITIDRVDTWLKQENGANYVFTTESW